jgi:hypothetical protein
MANPPHDEHLLSLHEAHLALLAAVTQGHGVTAEAALEEARNCITRHATEAPSLESAAQLVAEMRHWAITQAPQRQRAGEMDLRVEWSGDDGAWAAVFIRDGQPWWLDGALMGMAATPPKALEELLGVARHLVVEGSNFLMQDKPPLSAADRRWLFNLTDVGVSDDVAYQAVRNAEEAER